ncbi:SRPBCC domain-containing protein [Brevibacterium litoralis]|uniref:SRPBCC domain-containing protein n=1 Tax=Brevibacterium litoralis TaxID=3138935 RepID=UPI0032ECCB44
MITASVVTWENGTDLVLHATAPLPPAQVWRAITDPEVVAEWFAPFTRDDAAESAADTGATEDGEILTFTLDGEDLQAELLACEEEVHVLLEFQALGRVGITLEAPDPEDTASATRIVVTHTYTSLADAAGLIDEIGPVWETHLRYLGEVLGLELIDVSEDELYAKYAQLAAEVRDEAFADQDDAEDRNDAEDRG